MVVAEVRNVVAVFTLPERPSLEALSEKQNIIHKPEKRPIVARARFDCGRRGIVDVLFSFEAE